MDVWSYLVGKAKGGGGGGGADLSKYFNTEIKSNTSQWNNISNEIVKKTPPMLVDSNVTDLSFCFSSSTLKEIDVSQMDTSNITKMERMFYDCKQLEKLNVENWNVSKVDNFDYIFSGCTLLKKIDLSKWTPNSPSKYQSMFRDCSYLAIVDYSSFDFVGFYSFYNVGINCLQSEGAYADGIPYIYVKNANVQSQVLSANSGRPSSWTTANVVIKS